MTTTSRWQRKWERDHLTDGWSPIPTQIVSNEEYVPMPPTREQRRVADRLREMSRLHAAALGVTRRHSLGHGRAEHPTARQDEAGHARGLGDRPLRDPHAQPEADEHLR